MTNNKKVIIILILHSINEIYTTISIGEFCTYHAYLHFFLNVKNENDLLLPSKMVKFVALYDKNLVLAQR